MSKQTILITGASRGIGFLTAKTLVNHGHTVYAGMREINGRNKEGADFFRSLNNSVSGSIYPIEMDVTDNNQCNEVIRYIENNNHIDVLINNAGIMPVGLTEAFTEEQVQQCFSVNLYGAINCTKAVLPAMRKRKNGKLIHLSSSAGRLAIPYFGVYCASKWALEAYTESLHYELAQFNIHTCIVEPSGHATDLVSSSPSPKDAIKLEYGNLAQGGEKLLNMFKDMFSQGEETTNAQNVADQLLKLVEQTESLPLRIAIGQDMGVKNINDGTAPIQTQLIEQLLPVYE
ncbi:SDR family oxidoreductase [Glaciecola sp. 1036]|uniref:SDR family oxidoreductase n=1 Tax=Alteromonadaceae TaxID=72275 RepID=UPI003D00796F